MDLFLTFIIIILISIFIIKRKFSLWKSLGVAQFEIEFPYGSVKGVGTKIHVSEFTCNHYQKTKNIREKLSGFYMFIRPILMIVDLNIIKSILVKDFNIFPNRGFYYNEKDDPISAHIFNIENEEWKNLRHKLTPTFTSGKLKMMFATIDEVSMRLLKKLNESEDFVEIKDILARFTTDVIGSVAFGLECNSLENPASEFYKIGTKLFNQPSSFFTRFMRNSYKNLARKMHIKLLAQDISQFYLGITKETIVYREKNPHVERQDFMNLLIDMKQNGILTVEQIAAQCFVFFLAGYETSSSTMTYCMYELAINEDIQERARKSVFDVLKKYGNNFTYDAVGEMNYLECCVNETLRKYPVVSTLQRTAVREYKIPQTNVTISKDQAVWIPVYAIQHDPEIYPEPEKFKPERFMPEEVAKRHPMAFLPFGEGPSEFLVKLLKFFVNRQALSSSILVKFTRQANSLNLQVNVKGCLLPSNYEKIFQNKI